MSDDSAGLNGTQDGPTTERKEPTYSDSSKSITRKNAYLTLYREPITLDESDENGSSTSTLESQTESSQAASKGSNNSPKTSLSGREQRQSAMSRKRSNSLASYNASRERISIEDRQIPSLDLKPLKEPTISGKVLISIVTSPSERGSHKQLLVDLLPFNSQILISDQILAEKLAMAYKDEDGLRKRSLSEKERKLYRRRIVDFVSRWAEIRGDEIRVMLSKHFEGFRIGSLDVLTPSSVKHRIQPKPSALHVDDNFFSQIDPLSFVEHYCVMEMQIFVAIPAGVFCSSRLFKSNLHAQKFLLTWRQWHHWVNQITILDKPFNDKVRDLAKLIQIAKHFLDLQNFSAFVAVADVLAFSKRSGRPEWPFIPPHILDIWNDINRETDPGSGFRSFRARIKDATPPCIPYLQLFLSDMKHLEQKYALCVSDEKIPVALYVSLGRLSSILTTLQQFDREVPYEWELNPAIVHGLRVNLERCGNGREDFQPDEQRNNGTKSDEKAHSDDDGVAGTVPDTIGSVAPQRARIPFLAKTGNKPRIFKSLESLFGGSSSKNK